MSLGDLESIFREAAEALDPSSPSPATPASVRGQLTVYAVRGQRRWLEAAMAGLAGARAGATDDPTDWLDAACRGWVSFADRSLRLFAEELVGQLGEGAATVPARLLYWRTTGLRWVLDGALAMTPKDGIEGDCTTAAAAWGAYLASADEEFAVAARRGFGGGLATIPPRLWPAAAAALDLGPEDVTDEALEALRAAPPGVRLEAAGCLAAPIIRLEVEWFVASELREGPMAEAATYPWPAVRISFRKMDDRNQIKFHPSLAGEQLETIEDAGVVAAALEHIVDESDRGGLMEGMGRRRGRSLLRRR